MLLGVCWYYGFPKGLYHFDFFTFRPGRGGHADGPAELSVTVQAPDPVALLAAVQAVAARYSDCYLFGQAYGALLRLELSDYGLPDYTFHVAGELENVLRQQHVTTTAETLPSDTPLLHMAAPHDPYPRHDYGDGLVQAVSSWLKLHQAEIRLLRLDCHVLKTRQADLLGDLDRLCEEFGLDVFYYFDCALGEQVNLMLFFGNGRQGLGGQALRYTNTGTFRTAVAAILSGHGGQPGHLGDYPADYPQHGPHAVRVVDADFVL